MSAIFKRRSIRKYTEQLITDEQIQTILKAGMAAPSAGNAQPWHFIVIRDKEIINQIPSFHPYARMLYDVNCAIVVLGDPSLEKFSGFWVQDCSAATQNMLLMADELGLASVWLGVYPIEERVNDVRRLLAIPDSIIPLAILPVGYAAEQKELNNRFDISRIHTNQWTKK